MGKVYLPPEFESRRVRQIGLEQVQRGADEGANVRQCFGDRRTIGERYLSGEVQVHVHFKVGACNAERYFGDYCARLQCAVSKSGKYAGVSTLQSPLVSMPNVIPTMLETIG